MLPTLLQDAVERRFKFFIIASHNTREKKLELFYFFVKIFLNHFDKVISFDKTDEYSIINLNKLTFKKL